MVLNVKWQRFRGTCFIFISFNFFSELFADWNDIFEEVKIVFDLWSVLFKFLVVCMFTKKLQRCWLYRCVTTLWIASPNFVTVKLFFTTLPGTFSMLICRHCLTETLIFLKISLERVCFWCILPPVLITLETCAEQDWVNCNNMTSKPCISTSEGSKFVLKDHSLCAVNLH